jgi:hypothetical protein
MECLTRLMHALALFWAWPVCSTQCARLDGGMHITQHARLDGGMHITQHVHLELTLDSTCTLSHMTSVF